jgi:hypothetical protein
MPDIGIIRPYNFHHPQEHKKGSFDPVPGVSGGAAGLGSDASPKKPNSDLLEKCSFRPPIPI